MKKIVWPAVFSLVGFSAYLALRRTGGFVDQQALRYLLAFCCACLGVVVVRAGGFFCFSVLYHKRTRREAPGVLRIMFSAVSYALLLTLIFGFVLNYNVTGLIATSAALSVVIGLALQDTLGNFFAGVSLHIEQPFKIKDSIKFRDNAGEIESVSWRTTTMRTNNNTRVVFPNSMLARDPIEIFPFNELQRHSVGFPAPYSISPQTVIQTAKDAVRGLPGVCDEAEPTARITGFGDSSVDYEAIFCVKDYMKVGDIRAKLRERLWYALNRDNISMPFPTRHVLIERVKDECRQVAFEVDYRRVVEQVDIFDPLSPAEKETLVGSSCIKVYAPGECMVHCGEAGESMFIIGRGRAEVQVSSSGKSSTVAVLPTGAFFGEMSLFSGEPRSADVVAMEEVEVLEVEKSSIQRLLYDNTKLAEAFSRKVAERYADLKEHAGSIEQEEVIEEQVHLLQRIRRFFNLS